jgi:hypothetical protein
MLSPENIDVLFTNNDLFQIQADGNTPTNFAVPAPASVPEVISQDKRAKLHYWWGSSGINVLSAASVLEFHMKNITTALP